MRKDLQAVKLALASESGAYVPDFADIAKALGLPAKAMGDDDKVTLSAPQFRFLMLGWLIQQHFDEKAYLDANPDVAEAVRTGALESGWTHYLNSGFYEGRSPGSRYVDAKYYRRAYPDIALAERKGQTTAAEHYARTGYAEGRNACQAHATMANMWRASMGTL